MAEGKTMMKTQFLSKIVSLLVQDVDVESRNRNCVIVLHQALRDKVECVVDTLLQEGVSVSTKDDEGFSALFHAYKSKSVKMIDKVLQKGADVNEKHQPSGETVLHFALLEKMENIVDFLLEKGASVILNEDMIDKNSALYYAIASGQANLVNKVIEKGANVNCRFGARRLSPVHLAVEKNSIEVLRALLEKGSDPNKLDCFQCTALQYTVKDDQIDLAKTLLLHGATFETKHIASMLHLSNLSGSMARLLLQNGAQVDAIDKLGETPLMVASAHGLSKVVKVLLDQGAEVNRQDSNGRTALHRAATEDVVELLVNKGADVNAKDVEGNTSLVYGLLQERYGTVEPLLIAGSQVDVKNKSGQTFVLLYHKLDQKDQYFKTVTEYIIKLKIANLEENLTSKFLFNIGHFRAFEAVCLGEMNRLKVARHGESLYDVLSGKNDCSVLKNKLLVAKIKSQALESDYPIYCSLLRRSLRKILRRSKFIAVAKLTTTVTVGGKSTILNLPDYMTNQLIEIIPEHVIDSLV